MSIVIEPDADFHNQAQYILMLTTHFALHNYDLTKDIVEPSGTSVTFTCMHPIGQIDV